MDDYSDSETNSLYAHLRDGSNGSDTEEGWEVGTPVVAAGMRTPTGTLKTDEQNTANGMGNGKLERMDTAAMETEPQTLPISEKATIPTTNVPTTPANTTTASIFTTADKQKSQSELVTPKQMIETLVTPKTTHSDNLPAKRAQMIDEPPSALRDEEQDDGNADMHTPNKIDIQVHPESENATKVLPDEDARPEVAESTIREPVVESPDSDTIMILSSDDEGSPPPTRTFDQRVENMQVDSKDTEERVASSELQGEVVQSDGGEVVMASSLIDTEPPASAATSPRREPSKEVRKRAHSEITPANIPATETTVPIQPIQPTPSGKMRRNTQVINADRPMILPNRKPQADPLIITTEGRKIRRYHSKEQAYRACTICGDSMHDKWQCTVPFCYECGHRGHLEQNCPRKAFVPYEERRNFQRCGIRCGYGGHEEKNCPLIWSALVTTAAPDNPQYRIRPTCYICGNRDKSEPEHNADSCHIKTDKARLDICYSGWRLPIAPHTDAKFIPINYMKNIDGELHRVLLHPDEKRHAWDPNWEDDFNDVKSPNRSQSHASVTSNAGQDSSSRDHAKRPSNGQQSTASHQKHRPPSPNRSWQSSGNDSSGPSAVPLKQASSSSELPQSQAILNNSKKASRKIQKTTDEEIRARLGSAAKSLGLPSIDGDHNSDIANNDQRSEHSDNTINERRSSSISINAPDQTTDIDMRDLMKHSQTTASQPRNSGEMQEQSNTEQITPNNKAGEVSNVLSDSNVEVDGRDEQNTDPLTEAQHEAGPRNALVENSTPVTDSQGPDVNMQETVLLQGALPDMNTLLRPSVVASLKEPIEISDTDSANGSDGADTVSPWENTPSEISSDDGDACMRGGPIEWKVSNKPSESMHSVRAESQPANSKVFRIGTGNRYFGPY